MNRRKPNPLLSIALATWAATASAQEVPCDHDLIHLGSLGSGATHLEAVRNPAYGNGVIVAERVSGGITISRVDASGKTPLATLGGLSSTAQIRTLRYDTTPTAAFSGSLYLTVSTGNTASTVLYEVSPSGVVSTKTSYPVQGPNDGTALEFDFTDGAGGYTADTMYMTDIAKPTAFWKTDSCFMATKVSDNLLPAGRTDLDVAGLEFDRSGAFGHLLYLADSDANTDGKSAVYGLTSGLTWTIFQPVVSTGALIYKDLALCTGGSLGTRMFLAVHDKVGGSHEIRSVDPSGAWTTFASGFSALRSLTVSEDGSTLYVADQDGVHAIAPRTTLTGGPDVLPLSTGGTHTMVLDAGVEHAGDIFVVLGSISGTSPGVQVGDVCAPVQPDAYFSLLLTSSGAGVVTSPLGLLDAAGKGVSAFTIPAGLPPGLAGLEVSHTWVLAGTPFASNAVTLTLVP